MNRLFTFYSFLLFAFFAQSAFAQPTIEIPWGTAPTYDGVLSPGEWDDADTVFIQINSGTDSIGVLYKYDSLSLYFAYFGKLESSSIFFPEILIDVNHDRSMEWMMDDWWLHVSATDCEFQGQYGDYSNCLLTQPGWTAEPNITTGSPKTDTVEIGVLFATLGMNVQATDTFGIAFNVTNTATKWEFWPDTANQISPSTWANATFGSITKTGFNKDLARNIELFPNPVKRNLQLKIDTDKNQPVSWELIDLTGKTLMAEELGIVRGNLNKSYDLSRFPAGIYFARIHIGDGFIAKRVVVSK